MCVVVAVCKWTSLHYACFNGELDEAERLIKTGAVDIGAKSIDVRLSARRAYGGGRKSSPMWPE